MLESWIETIVAIKINSIRTAYLKTSGGNCWALSLRLKVKNRTTSLSLLRQIKRRRGRLPVPEQPTYGCGDDWCLHSDSVVEWLAVSEIGGCCWCCFSAFEVCFRRWFCFRFWILIVLFCSAWMYLVCVWVVEVMLQNPDSLFDIRVCDVKEKLAHTC